MKRVSFVGRVISGEKKGAYYLSFEEYKKQFKEKFNFIPYPGTLNLVVKPKNKKALEKIGGIKISGFVKEGKTFGSLKCFPALINKKISGVVVIPELSSHGENIIEIISDIYLRKKFNLIDGDEVDVELY